MRRLTLSKDAICHALSGVMSQRDDYRRTAEMLEELNIDSAPFRKWEAEKHAAYNELLRADMEGEEVETINMGEEA